MKFQERRREEKGGRGALGAVFHIGYSDVEISPEEISQKVESLYVGSSLQERNDPARTSWLLDLHRSTRPLPLPAI